MKITASMVKELRDKTGAGVMDSRRALDETEGDIAKAIDVLKKRGLSAAEKKADRVASQGMVETYIHAGGRIGAMVQVNCETDFVARLPEFREMVHNIAMQIAASNPKYVRLEDMPEGCADVPNEAVLMEQPFIKDASHKIGEIVINMIARTGENIRIRRFTRYELGA
ncbi:MAG: translation elongation factor Ts [Dehalococcoidia bacterium]|nr:translation elongation factor Ts [Dehalococcoidia bacterium]